MKKEQENNNRKLFGSLILCLAIFFISIGSIIRGWEHKEMWRVVIAFIGSVIFVLLTIEVAKKVFKKAEE